MRKKTPDNLNFFERCKVVDHALRTYSVVHGMPRLGGFLDVFFDSLEGLEPFLADAREGQLLQLKVKVLTPLELRDFFDHGVKMLGAQQSQPSAKLKEPTELEKMFVTNTITNEISAIDEKYRAYMIMYLTLCYLASVGSISYRQLTNKGDVEVAYNIADKKTFWDMNLDPEHVLRIMYEFQLVSSEVSVVPQVIFSKRESLELCHLIGMVSKFGKTS